MAGFKDREKRHFPLQNVKSVVNLVRDQLESTDQPNIALVSIVLGAIEHALTVNRTVPQDFNSRICLEPIFPVVELSTVEALYQKFVAQIKGSVDLSQHEGNFTTRELVKKVSDVLWAGLSRSFKDKAHLQSLYAYLTGMWFARPFSFYNQSKISFKITKSLPQLFLSTDNVDPRCYGVYLGCYFWVTPCQEGRC